MKKTLVGMMVASLCLVSSATPAAAQSTNDDVAVRAALLAQIQSLTQLLLQLQAQIASGNVQTSEDDSVFTETVAEGSENESVRLLQRVLASDPAIYPEARVTGYFGTLTTNALRRFQTEWGLQVTGTFTPETRYVLSAVLEDRPLDGSTEDYLQQPAVRTAMTNAIGDYVNRPTIVNGRVAFSNNPDFSFGARNSDIATLQRIFATDPLIYPEAAITGTHDAATAQAIILFQTRYGVAVTGQVDAATLEVLNALLVLNNSTTIRPDLLLLPAAQPARLIPNSSRDIIFVSVVRDERANEARVTVTYEGGTTESFTLGLSAVRTDSAAASAIASRLGRPVSDVSGTLTTTTIETMALPRRIVFYLSRADDLTASIYFTDGDSYGPSDMPENVDFSVPVFIGGQLVRLDVLMEDFKRTLRSGNFEKERLDEEMHQLIADIYGIPVSQARSVSLSYVVESISDGA